MAVTRTRRGIERDLPSKPKPRSDAYTGMLFISLLAMITGCVLLYMDYAQYEGRKPNLPSAPTRGMLAPAGGAAPK